MHTFVAVYTAPEEPERFDEAYFGTHMPLIARVPGLVRSEVSRVTRMLRGQERLHLMAELSFADGDALRAALASPEWAEAGRNLAEIGGLELATMFLAETVEDGAATT